MPQQFETAVVQNLIKWPSNVGSADPVLDEHSGLATESISAPACGGLAKLQSFDISV